MAPNFNNSDFVVTWPRLFSTYRTGDVVVVQHTTYGRIIKRIDHITATSLFALTGDNPQSTSRDKLGTVTRQQIVGKVCWHIKS
jgi:phage repressor protein C with HTH and peptisase S24 domain